MSYLDQIASPTLLIDEKITKANIKFLGLNLDFSIEKAKRILGYAPAKTFDEGMAETLNWYKNKS